MIITGEQVNAARKLLGWSLEVLANKVRMSEIDIARFEAGKQGMSSTMTALIRRALETAGVEFTNGREPGIKLRKTE
jgi:ribosome-binding protein aMBF1 (putative translation factor)